MKRPGISPVELAGPVRRLSACLPSAALALVSTAAAQPGRTVARELDSIAGAKLARDRAVGAGGAEVAA